MTNGRGSRCTAQCTIFGWWLMVLAAAPSHVFAQETAIPIPIHVRAGVAVATMVSKDQNQILGFDSAGFVGDLQIGYGLLPWLDVRVGAAGGGFASKNATGGLLQPQLGAALGWPLGLLRPWLQLDVGAGFTGQFLRPVWRASIGLDLRVSNALTLGPTIGYWHLFQHDGPTYSTDARFAFLGVVIGWQPSAGLPPQREHIVTHEHIVTREDLLPEPELPPPPLDSTPAPPSEPSPELLMLIESTLPSQQQEWLAPVLFGYDSDVLESQGIAMLHEVANELKQRPGLKRLEIRGYADVRGSREYNLALSERRAHAVLEWLVTHGIARERLTLAAQGAADFVEHGADEPAHEQNRRVVFRVLEADKP